MASRLHDASGLLRSNVQFRRKYLEWRNHPPESGQIPRKGRQTALSRLRLPCRTNSHPDRASYLLKAAEGLGTGIRVRRDARAIGRRPKARTFIARSPRLIKSLIRIRMIEDRPPIRLLHPPNKVAGGRAASSRRRSAPVVRGWYCSATEE